ncbi:MAG: MoxR family ATPase [Bryobacteraceae bacterium]
MVQRETASDLDTAAARVRALEASLAEAIRGKAEAIRLSLVCLLAKGHLLIEDVPGVGKTTLAHSLARAVRCQFHRLQFTADMLPGDVLGVTLYNAQSREFEFKPGPIFTNFLLADEINRATPKTQSALLEAMNELQITIDGKSYTLDPPFMVIATQNPVEHHGTYPLPESQLDRFLLRIEIGYPDSVSERQILRQTENSRPSWLEGGVIDAREILDIQEQVRHIRVDEALVDYMLRVVERTRSHESLTLGVSPRGAQALYRATQALALVEGRDYAIPDDVKRLVIPVFAHRVMVNTRLAMAQRGAGTAATILGDILTLVDVPL